MVHGQLLLTVALFIVSALAGFVVLPLLQPNLRPRTIWQAICSAAGVQAPIEHGAGRAGLQVSTVVMKPGMFEGRDSAASGRGATLAQQCAICHGAEGISRTNFPNLAGQYAEVIYKELNDFKSGARVNATMTPFAQILTDQRCGLAAYLLFPASAAKPVRSAKNRDQWCAAPEYSALRLLPWRSRP